MTNSIWLQLLVLTVGCSTSERDNDTAMPWPFEEPESVSEYSQLDPVILRASEDDPFFGEWDDFFRDVPSNPEQTRCAGMGISLELPFDPPLDALLVLPRTITRGSETYAFEVKRTSAATWVWEPEEVGLVWASNTPVCGDPFAEELPPLRFSTSYYPYSAQTPPQPMPTGTGPYQLCV